MNIEKDYRQRFVFDQLDARGCIVRLSETCESVQATHHYPPNLASLLNQFALAAVLLRDSIKIDGSLTIQLRTPSAIKLIMADCMSDGRVRAIAEYLSDELAANDLLNLNSLGEGSVLAITITPDEGDRYQSIVPIENMTLSECLADYFQRSEQLPTKFKFFASQEEAMGIALHALPAQLVKDKATSEENFSRIGTLLQTLSKEEAFSISSEKLLTRLFHDESCRVFDAVGVEFGCMCSASKSLDAIKSLGQDDVADLILEQKDQGNSTLVTDCHFCFQRYEFEFSELADLFVE